MFVSCRIVPFAHQTISGRHMTFAAARASRCLSLLAIFMAPAAVLAHPVGMMVADGWSGFLHPFTGLDHLLAMLAVGLWAARLSNRAMWMLPVAFPFAMVLGASLPALGMSLPTIEPMIAISVITLGAAVALGLQVRVTMSAALVGVFALFHGYAHAVEADARLAPYAVGFVLATVLLHGVGLIMGVALRERPLTQRMIGGCIALAGAALLTG
jgi:urease accessory protein